MMILDLADPAKPKEVGRWWIPGQWQAGGEDYPWDELGAAALPSSAAHAATGSMSATGTTASSSSTSPTCRSRSWSRSVNTSPAFPHPTHTCLPHAAEAQGPRHHGGGRRGRRQALAVAAGLCLDLRHHRRAAAGADRDLPGAGPRQGRRAAAGDDAAAISPRSASTARSFPSPGSRKGCGSSTSPIRSRRRRSAFYVPDPPEGADVSSSNDVTIDRSRTDLPGRPLSAASTSSKPTHSDEG